MAAKRKSASKGKFTRGAQKARISRGSAAASSKTKIAIIGSGNMGSAFARAFVRTKQCRPSSLLVVESDQEKASALSREIGCPFQARIQSNLKRFSIIFLAVKPLDANSVCSALKDVLAPNQVVVSIMAGVPIKALSAALGGHRKIVRCMPNTPAQYGMGMSVFLASKELSHAERAQVDALLTSVGISLEINREELVDAATAVSGSGPAYVFYFIEHLLNAARKLGFSPDEAEVLVAQTVAGALTLWTASGEPPAELRRRVTSKGGTTAAAIEVFDNANLNSTINTALERAYTRCRELAHAFESAH